MPSLTAQIAVVTGASSGIGEATARAFGARGDRVVLVARREDRLRQVAASLPDSLPIPADLTKPEEPLRIVDAAAARYGQIDVLVNNAGLVRDNLLGLLGEDDVRTVLETNVGGVFNVTRAVVTHMIARRAGKIINVSSVADEKGGRGQTNYAASKGAINAFTRALAVELAPRRITVNTVAPGVIETDMSQAIRDRAGEEVKSRILLRRFGTAAEVAYAVWFLASRFADYITGEVLHVDGGFKME